MRSCAQAWRSFPPLIQIEEPILCTDWLDGDVLERFAPCYAALNEASGNRILLTAYFGSMTRNLELVLRSPCLGLHADLVRGDGLEDILAAMPESMFISLGLVNGRNIWRNDYAASLGLIRLAVDRLGAERVMLGTSCSLLHCPVDLSAESALPDYIKNRMSFAVQKCAELVDLRTAASGGGEEIADENRRMLEMAAGHEESLVPRVRERLSAVGAGDLRRKSRYALRRQAQGWLRLPLLPATSIGSYPQTGAIRRLRADYRQGRISRNSYEDGIRAEIRHCIAVQEALGLDVLVHGEAERNDMVEYFGEMLGGFCFSRNGWVQSYGSRCVKPPIIYGDVYRKAPMTVSLAKFAQSLTDRPVKGMLTGPVTILCWSFVREDLPRSEICRQIALAVRDEVLDLEKGGIRIIQIDEAALREGMPLTRREADEYLRWAVDAFLLATSGVQDSTQIHTHMCYSEFNSILPWIAQMDADVISIEASRSGMELLEAFVAGAYQAQVGPGIYDIHSPRVPDVEEMAGLLEKALKHLEPGQLWVNPDCGLKTRQWEEALPSLRNMVEAARLIRTRLKKTGKAGAGLPD